MPGTVLTFQRLSILFRPHQSKRGFPLHAPRRFAARLPWWRRRVPPPGPDRLLRKRFSTIADVSAGTVNLCQPFAFDKGFPIFWVSG